MTDRTCSIEGCTRGGRLIRGWCGTHYQRWWAYGDPNRTPPTREERFLANVERRDDGCWVWTGYRDEDGYGRFLFGLDRRSAHRWSYEHFVGSIPEGMHLDHLCHSRGGCLATTDCPHRPCVNPDHLEIVTLAENNRRKIKRVKTHCPHGHAFTPENTSLDGGVRKCRTCRRAQSKARYWARHTPRAVPAPTTPVELVE